MPALNPKLSLAMIVKNEARCLARCLASVRPIVDELVIVDTGSSDATVEIAKKFSANISDYRWTNDFAAARNVALAQATGDWVLVLDADEFASEVLREEIRDFTKQKPAVGRLRIVSDFRSQGSVMRSQTFVSRLFPRGGHFEGRIHEQLVAPWPRANLRGELWHDGYLEKTKSDRNIALLLIELKGEPKNAYLLHQLAIEYVSLDETEKAFPCLVKAFGAMKRDDLFAPNVAVDLIYSAVALKKFEIGSEVIAKSEGLLEDFPDFHLARGLFYMNLVRSNVAGNVSQLPKIEESFRRCLALGETDKYKSVQGTGTFLANYNLGVYYHAFGKAEAARKCFETAAAQGYPPAAAILAKLK